jgi:hypothetical protein
VVKQLGIPVLRPITRLWLRSAELAQSQLPQPLDMPHVHTAGTNPDRLLIVGTGAVAGVGVLTHELALAGHLARNLSALTGRAMDMDIIGDNLQTVRTAVHTLAAVSLARYDAVILYIGTNEAMALSSAPQWRRDLDELTTRIEKNSPASVRVFLVGIPQLELMGLIPHPIVTLANRNARMLNTVSREFAATHSRIRFIEFDPERLSAPEKYRSSETYEYWARILATPIAAGLSSEPRERNASIELEHDETSRQEALDRLGILYTASEERFDRITQLAQKMFCTSGAALTFIDRDRQWFKSHPGILYDSTPRSIAFGAVAITSAEPFVVEDASLDPRFCDSPLVTGTARLRFYAGHPIDAENGEHIGTLCIVDTQPRNFTDADASLLRNLAMMAQNELHLGEH